MNSSGHSASWYTVVMPRSRGISDRNFFKSKDPVEECSSMLAK